MIFIRTYQAKFDTWAPVLKDKSFLDTHEVPRMTFTCSQIYALIITFAAAIHSKSYYLIFILTLFSPTSKVSKDSFWGERKCLKFPTSLPLPRPHPPRPPPKKKPYKDIRRPLNMFLFQLISLVVKTTQFKSVIIFLVCIHCPQVS